MSTRGDFKTYRDCQEIRDPEEWKRSVKSLKLRIMFDVMRICRRVCMRDADSKRFKTFQIPSGCVDRWTWNRWETSGDGKDEERATANRVESKFAFVIRNGAFRNEWRFPIVSNFTVQLLIKSCRIESSTEGPDGKPNRFQPMQTSGKLFNLKYALRVAASCNFPDNERRAVVVCRSHGPKNFPSSLRITPSIFPDAIKIDRPE